MKFADIRRPLHAGSANLSFHWFDCSYLSSVRFIISVTILSCACWKVFPSKPSPAPSASCAAGVELAVRAVSSSSIGGDGAGVVSDLLLLLDPAEGCSMFTSSFACFKLGVAVGVCRRVGLCADLGCHPSGNGVAMA